MKPEPPVYPRPVPSIDFDELPIFPGTVVYSHEQDLDAKEIAAKRRRIEANANAYLRGEELFILSAGLRGPFNGGWQNPWADKNKKRRREVEVETSSKRVRITPRGRGRAKDTTTPIIPAKSQIIAEKQENPFERTIRTSEPPSHDEKVKSWLRRSSALPPESFIVPTSPTPEKRAVVPESKLSSKPIWTPTKQKITVNSQDVRAPYHQIVSRATDSFDPAFAPGSRPVVTHDKLQGALHANDRTRHSRHSTERSTGHPSRHVTRATEEPVRAEDAILNLKRRSEEPKFAGVDDMSIKQSILQETEQIPTHEVQVQAEARQSLALHEISEPAPIISKPVPEDLSKQDTPLQMSRGQKVKLKELDDSSEYQRETRSGALREDTAMVLVPATTHEVSLPLESTDVSQIQSAKLLPSAQPRLELQPSTSNISSGALLPDLPADFRKETVVTNDLKDPTGGTDEESDTSASVQHEQVLDDDKVIALVEALSNGVSHGSQTDTAVGQVTPRPFEQKAMGQQRYLKSPGREGNTHPRMSQTSLSGSIVKSPASIQRARSAKKPKKASFAAEASFTSSHGSIKSALKVQKADSGDRGGKSTPARLMFSESIEFDVPEEGARISKELTTPLGPGSPRKTCGAEVWKVPRSILKSKSTHSSAAAALASAMLSPRHREGSSLSKKSDYGIQPSGQNGVLLHQQEENFDLEGALDDLGSFLSTWDAEKERLHAV